MNGLLEKLNEYNSIVNFRLSYELNNNQTLDIKIRKQGFPHLIGLHKLVDIPIIRQFNDPANPVVSAKFLISKIRKESLLTEDIVKASKYYSLIETRYETFNKTNLLNTSYTDVIINFDSSVIGSSLLSDFILFDELNNGYTHLCIAKDSSGTRYLESFFYEKTNKYILNQKLEKIKKIKIYDSTGDIFFEDELIK